MPFEHTHSADCTVEAVFTLHGSQLPIDHSAALYAAIRDLPIIGDWIGRTDSIAIAPIPGRRDADGLLTLTDESRLLLRLPADALRWALELPGQRLDIDGLGLRLDVGQAQVRLLKPAARLYAELVVFDDGVGWVRGTPVTGGAEAAFQDEIRRRLAALEIRAAPDLGPAGALQLPEGTVPGFKVSIDGLSPEDSIHLQEAGLGDHRKLGCGVFLPR